MKNKYYLFFPVLLFALLNPIPAKADCEWNLLTFLFGCGVFNAKKAVSDFTYNIPSCVENARGQVKCINKKYKSQAEIEAGRDEMRRAAQGTKFSKAGCQTYRDGCRNCPGSQHSMVFESRRGHKIRINNPGQNYLQQDIRAVLMAMADRRQSGITVTSGYRSCNYQRTRGVGVRRSQHLLGNAADFKFDVGSPSHGRAAAYAKETLGAMRLSGGTGTYCGAAAHVDTGNQRQWNWCGRRGKR